MAWTDMTSTVPLADHPEFLGLVAVGVHATFIFFNGFGQPEVSDDVACRMCAASCACQGFIAFGDTWTGSCPTTAPSGTVTDLSSWGRGGSIIWTKIYSTWTTRQITVPGSYTVGVEKSGLALNVNTTSTDMAAYFQALAPGLVEYEVTAVTATVAVNSYDTAGPTDWTGILRKPGTPDRNPHYILPSEFGSYPQIATLSPGASTGLTLSLARSGGSFSDTIYMSSTLAELGSQDLGKESLRYGSWLVERGSLDITWRYRQSEVVPGQLAIDDLGLDARVYFEP